MEFAPWGIGVLLLLVFAISAAGNLRILVRTILRRTERCESLVPLVGGLCGTGGLLILPAEALRAYWWLPLVLDVGAAPIVCYALAWQIVRWCAQRAGKP